MLCNRSLGRHPTGAREHLDTAGEARDAAVACGLDRRTGEPANRTGQDSRRAQEGRKRHNVLGAAGACTEGFAIGATELELARDPAAPGAEREREVSAVDLKVRRHRSSGHGTSMLCNRSLGRHPTGALEHLDAAGEARDAAVACESWRTGQAWTGEPANRTGQDSRRAQEGRKRHNVLGAAGACTEGFAIGATELELARDPAAPGAEREREVSAVDLKVRRHRSSGHGTSMLCNRSLGRHPTGALEHLDAAGEARDAAVACGRR
ncbi:hypothetical protein NDU88_001349 [Pleurodeles waltl]|uniref:Uncharacterized protein n=1 Tax=Pleurodeles waltl TaxID=8319 RepID=A0AAV7SZC2_PLEWA|nr:hypothetical protein NDU88_001349 [Pleurodeles waltl]